MKYSLSLGKVSGIKISVHWTFLILIAWIVISNMRSGSGAAETAWSVGFILAIFGCVILHELGHAMAAKRYKINTLDITILPIGGIAQLEAMPEKPKEELVVALAGPAVNVIIFAILFPFVRQTSDIDELDTLKTINAENFLPALMGINLWLALFNLIPAFPMDGGRVLRALLGFKLNHSKATRIAASVGQVLAMAFVFLGFFYNPFLIFIGFFIFLGAQSEAMHAQSKFLLKGFTVKDVIMHQIPLIDSSASIKEAANKLLDSQNKVFLVVKDDKPVGTLSRDQIINALAEQGETASVDKFKDNDLLFLEPKMELEKAWSLMQQKKKSILPVLSDGHLIGAVDQENIAEFILIRSVSAKREARKETEM
jgi:Zn-dependent protease/predicted transcriptional regulator